MSKRSRASAARSETARAQSVPPAVPGRAHYLAAVVAAAGSLVWYLISIAPTVTGEDSGELVSAAWTLGIPHPPGYPLWCLVARAFMLLPVGDVAFRANLASAACAAAAVGVVALIAARLGARPLAAVFAALLVGASTELWGQAVIAEVYALSTLLIAGVLYALLAWRQSGDDRRLFAAAFLSGLATGAHPTIVLLVPAVAVYLIAAGPSREGSVRRVVGVALALAAGGAIYVYLPLRAAAHPAMNWGDPETWQRFWAHVTRAQYKPIVSGETGADFLAQTKALVGFYRAQWPLLVDLAVAVLAPVGFATLWRRRRPEALLLAAAFVALSVGYLPILDFGIDEEALHVAEVFFIPAWACLALLAGVAVETAAERVGRPLLVGALALVLPLASFPASLGSVTMHGNTVARRFGQDLLDTLPPHAILFTSADYEAFPVTYLQIVEGLRRDVLALDEQRDLGRALAAVGMAGADDPYAALARAARPVFFTRRQVAGGGVAFRPVGLLLHLVPAGPGADAARAEDAAAWRSLALLPEGPWIQADWSTASIAARYEEARARSELASGETADALARVARAAALLPGDPVHLNDLGALLAEGGQLDPALDYYRRSIALRPTYLSPQYNRITALMGLGRWDEAQRAYAEALHDGVAFGDLSTPLEAALTARAAR